MSEIGWCIECGWRSPIEVTDLECCIDGHRHSVIRTDLDEAVFNEDSKARLARLLVRKATDLSKTTHTHSFADWLANLLYLMDECVELPVEED